MPIKSNAIAQNNLSSNGRASLGWLLSKDGLSSTLPPKAKIEVWYQPIVSTKTWHVVGFEALARVVYRGLVYPPGVAFKGLSSDNTKYLFFHVLSHIIRDYRFLQHPIGINVEPDVLVLSDVIEQLQGVPGEIRTNIFIELIETPIRNRIVVEAAMRVLALSGYRFSVDDFGSMGAGLHSTFMPDVSHVKFDGGLTFEPYTSRHTRLLSGISTVFRRETLHTVLEQVETIAQVIRFKDHFDAFQGYFFSPPRKVEDLTAGRALTEGYATFVADEIAKFADSHSDRINDM